MASGTRQREQIKAAFYAEYAITTGRYVYSNLANELAYKLEDLNLFCIK